MNIEIDPFDRSKGDSSSQGCHKRWRSTVDGAIAALICTGVYSPQSSGIGGGFLMVVYKKEEGLVETLISREKAPHYADKDMFQDEPWMAKRG